MTRGEYAREKFMEEVKAITQDVVAQIAAAKMERNTGAGSGSTATAPNIQRPEDALDCPKCKKENRAGFLIEREGANGKFTVCALGRDACGYISDSPKNAKQRKALTQTPCPVCESAMRLRLPKEKGKTAWLSCIRYPDCKGSRSFDEKSSLQEPKPLPEAGPPCTQCKTPMVKRGPASNGAYFWSCPRWRSDGSGCNAKPVWINEARA